MKFFCIVLVLGGLLGACVERKADLDCAVSGDRVVLVQLMFGRAIGKDGLVSEDEWRDFVASALTPAFPEGLTVQDAQGQWRDAATGAVVREPSKLVTVVATDTAATTARLATIINAYKTRFRQDAVGLFLTPACGGFR